MILYRYASKKEYADIVQTNTLRPSDPWTTMDVSYGSGWYFTDLAPDQCNAWTAACCWRNLSFLEKVKFYLTFDIPEKILKQCRKHVYMIPTWDNRIRYVGGSETPGCPKGPCILCDLVSKVKRFFGLK